MNLKLPQFWPADPDLVFAQVEAQVANRGITQQKTCFDYIITSLAPEFTTKVRDLILHSPASHLYEALCEQLVQCTAVSKRHRLQQLLTAEELGDRKPSQLLRRMEQLMATEQRPPTAPSCVNFSYSDCQRTCEWCQCRPRIPPASQTSPASPTGPWKWRRLQ